MAQRPHSEEALAVFNILGSEVKKHTVFYTKDTGTEQVLRDAGFTNVMVLEDVPTMDVLANILSRDTKLEKATIMVSAADIQDDRVEGFQGTVELNEQVRVVLVADGVEDKISPVDRLVMLYTEGIEGERLTSVGLAKDFSNLQLRGVVERLFKAAFAIPVKIYEAISSKLKSLQVEVAA